MFWIIGGLILAVAVAGVIWLNTSPQFGGKHTEEDIARFEASGHYEDGIFVNLIPTSLDMSLGEMWDVTLQMFSRNGNKKPESRIAPKHISSNKIVPVKEAQVMWFGHSSLLVMIEGKNILIDPMLGDVPAPHPTLGNRRFQNELPIEIDSLPRIDAILISHDHYDHLDYGSIQKLKGKCETYYVPLGVGAHLVSWGIPESQITEFNWWDELDHDGLTLAFTPARHFSGRGLTNRATTLWGSWVINAATERIFFSGDSGYGDHFKEIGAKYGPFDLAMMECGQYNELWHDIHMMPEETAQAGLDVGAKRVMPIHWGSFSLAMHSWTDPVDRFVSKAKELEVQFLTPEVGDLFKVSDQKFRGSQWWHGIK